MIEQKGNRFDEAAATWDTVPLRVELARGVGEAILHQVKPTEDMDVLDYGCGTGLLSLFLLPHVRSVTGVDSSEGMLQVLEEKIKAGGLSNLRTERLDLQHEPLPKSRYHLIAANMVLHHVKQTSALLKAFHQILHPSGYVAISDLDTEPGVFHAPGTVGNVFHHGFDRDDLLGQLQQSGFEDLKAVTAHLVYKPIASGEMREFPVFLMTGRRG